MFWEGTDWTQKKAKEAGHMIVCWLSWDFLVTASAILVYAYMMICLIEHIMPLDQLSFWCL